MTTIPEPTVTPTTYTVTCLPEDDIDVDVFTITVEYRGEGRWGVFRSGRSCLSTDGRWEWEPSPSNCEDDWLTSHRFDLGTALHLAKRHAPLMKVNGHTVAEVLSSISERE